MIAVGLPVLCFLLLIRIVRWMEGEFCGAVLSAAVAWGVVVTGLTEGLGHFRLLTYGGILGAWGGVDLLLALLLITPSFLVQGKRFIIREDLGSSVRGSERWFVAGVVVIVAMAGIAGLVSAPANWDSMTYHLSRVMHWMHNHTLDHYPTRDIRQLYQGPWAEFAILQFQILADGDRFAFGVQWMAWLVSFAAVWGIAGQLGADGRGRVMSVVFAATVPAAVLQAESTQNNLVVAAWLLCAVYFLLRYGNRTRRGQIGLALAFGASIGLALLTKGTAYALGFPIGVWFLVVALRQGRRGVVGLAIAGIVVLSLNVGHIERNIKTFGSPLMPESELSQYRPDAMTPSLLASNVLRNLGTQLASPDQRMNDWLQDALEKVHGWLGVDINDRRITVEGPPYDVQAIDSPMHEDFASNPIHTLLIGGALVWVIVSGLRAKRPGRAGILLAVAMVSFLLFCATLKWQIFHTRLHLPIFLLAAAPVGIWLASPSVRTVGAWICAGLLLQTIPYLLWNPSHPWIGSQSIVRVPHEWDYFRGDGTLWDFYRRTSDFLAAGGHDSIGLLAEHDDWEYPLWVMLRDRLGHWPDIQCDWSANDKVVGRPDLQWKNISAIIVTRRELFPQIVQVPAYSRWHRQLFGDVLVLTRPE